MASSTPRQEALKLRYEDLRRENERLRDARASLTRQLGPLPISAAVAAALLTGFEDHGKTRVDLGLAHLALWLFGAMILVSVAVSGLAPYRKLRDKQLAKQRERGPTAQDAENPEDWYERMIEIEELVRDGTALPRASPEAEPDEQAGPRPGATSSSPSALRGWERPFGPKTLTGGFELEWWGLFLTKLLFAAVIALLVLARLN